MSRGEKDGAEQEPHPLASARFIDDRIAEMIELAMSVGLFDLIEVLQRAKKAAEAAISSAEVKADCDGPTSG